MQHSIIFSSVAFPTKHCVALDSVGRANLFGFNEENPGYIFNFKPFCKRITLKKFYLGIQAGVLKTESFKDFSSESSLSV